MSGLAGDRRDRHEAELVEKAATIAEERAGDTTPGVATFVRQYFNHVAAEDLVSRDAMDLAGAALSNLELARQRPPGTPLVRLLNPRLDQHGWESPHTVVEVVTDDMPFLVDSVCAEFTRQDIAMHLVIHPVPRVRRDAIGSLVEVLDAGATPAPDEMHESFIHVEVDRETDPAILDTLHNDLRRVLEDVRCAVEDWPRMCARANELIAELSQNPPAGLDADDVAETGELLRWMVDGNFTFLGYREYTRTGSDADPGLASLPGTGLGIVRDSGLEPVSRSFANLPPAVRAKAFERRLLTLTKANSRATVSRPAYLDYVGVKRFDASGEVIGERRLLGLFAPRVYNTSATTIPVVRRKMQRVLDRAGCAPRSHDYLDLIQILESYPRDELFQIGEDELLDIATGILRLQERRHVAVFVRTDDYGRFVSVLLFLPRERYTTQVRLRLQAILLEVFHGTGVDHETRFTESVLARVHFVVRTDPGATVDVDLDAVRERLVAASRSWPDELAEALVEQYGEERGRDLLRLYGDAFPEAYKEDFPAHTAVADLGQLEALPDDGGLSLDLYRPAGSPDDERRFKVFRTGPALSLSAVMPLLQDMGVEVTDERPYEIERPGHAASWVYDFGLRGARGSDDDTTERERFQDTFAAVWRGDSESDGFNALVLRGGLTWRQVALLRLYAKYLRQGGSTFSQAYIQSALTRNAGVAAMLVALFEARFEPARNGEQEEQARLIDEITAALEAVASLDEDRILRAYLALIVATLRTNAYQPGADGTPKSYVAVKLDPKQVPDLPAPRPAFEIYVYAPRVEGVHLRFGPVARGGIRWSDRMEDFRTEVLGLVKAQMVKNAVIVPVGAKGGFVVKRPPDGADRDALMAEVIACYSTFISGLLDVTDNLVGGEIVPPPDVVRHDDDDPYLVVAADKGTATFSDIANAIAMSYGFWLGDAFASGGSSGYDHKGMGITARGAWESVKRHFREMGRDTQTSGFTAVGIGDMSGDVFGNGMLLSRHTTLVAAFDHRHVFLDPAPDPATSFAERERLFRLPRSSWDDYDKTLLSPGGGVYPRTLKSIPISPQVRAVLGVGADALTPAEVMRAILLAPVDLLWNGGIGTYVKASTESHADVGDKANDPIRVDGAALRCQVVGEGGNLGVTQRGRIEYALAGGRINTDAIDNSAGVDTSDHEVNIKILLNAAVASGDLTMQHRDDLLAEMTDEVAALVLRDNYEQTLAIGIARAQASSMLHVHSALVDGLEKLGKLDRAIEQLPDEKTVAARRAAGIGFTGPEFAVLLAYTKITLTAELLTTDIAEDPYLSAELVRYFPTPLRERYRDLMQRHRLRREIAVTGLVNRMVNEAGTTFLFRMAGETAAASGDVVRAQAAAREVFAMPQLWADIEALDNVVDAAVQTSMVLESRRLVERATRWLLHRRRPPLDIAATIAAFASGVAAVVGRYPGLLAGGDRTAMDERNSELVAAGVPEETATRVARSTPAYSALDVVDVAAATGRPVDEVADLYFGLDERLRLGRLRQHILDLPRDDRWRTLARAAVRDDLYGVHASLVTNLVRDTSTVETVTARIDAWVTANGVAVERFERVVADIETSGTYDLATLSVALRQMRGVLDSAAESASA